MTGYRYLVGSAFGVCLLMTIACASWVWLIGAAACRFCLVVTDEP